MLKYVNYSVVFQEVPDEVALTINFSNCPNRCKGCHSPYLMEDIGKILDNAALIDLLGKYAKSVTCICFMGGDSDPEEIMRLASLVRKSKYGDIKTAWYSGRERLPVDFNPADFDYIKLGPYVERLGGLDSIFTNQRFYTIKNGVMVDITHVFNSN